MNVTDAVRQRYSCRAFTSKEVSKADIRRLLHEAARAPSGGNLQPWSVRVITGEPKDRLVAELASRHDELPDCEGSEYPIYPPDLHEPYRTRRFTCGKQLYDALSITREDRAGRFRQFARNYEFFGAPVGLFVIVDRAMGAAQWSDLGMFIQTFMLLAQEAGFHTCAQEAWAKWPKTLARHLDLTDNEMVFCGISLGHADTSHPINAWRTERADVDEFTTFSGF